MKKLYFLLFFLVIYSMNSQIVINEYMPYPSTTSVTDDNELDSNKDGTLSGLSDEYIELVNSGVADLDISGWKIKDGSDRHIFPANTIVPKGGTIIVFGGGTGLSSADFGNSLVQISSESTSLGLTNGGDTFSILNASGVVQATETYTVATIGKAFTRSPDITGAFVTHPANSNLQAEGGGNAFASPGTKIDGSLFIAVTSTDVQFSTTSGSVDEAGETYDLTISIIGEDATNATTVEVALTSGSATDIDNYTTQTVTFPAASSASQVVTLTITDDNVIEGGEDLIFTLQNIAGGNAAVIGTSATHTLTIVDNEVSPTTLVVNEFMPWPAGATSTETKFDANGDGVYGGFSDEYIELVNSGSSSLDISGWKINDGIDRHIFPANTLIPSGGVILVFGGGNPSTTANYFGNAIVQTASESTSLGMSNSGDALSIKDNTDTIRLEFSYSVSTRAVAIARNPDITGNFAPHPVNTSGPKNEDSTDAKASPGTKIDGTTLSNEVFEALDFKIYPNPVNNGFVNISSNISGDKNIELHDLKGSRILKTKLKSDILDVSTIKSGFYLLKISFEGNTSTSKLIIN